MLNEKESYYTDSEGVGFPYFSTLKGKSARAHEQKIKCFLESFGAFTDVDVFEKIEFFGRKVEHDNALNGELKISKILSFYGLDLSSNVFLNWGQFNEIDVISVESLSNFFYDIWFPNADDVYLYDESFKWIINITHYGAILTLGPNREVT